MQSVARSVPRAARTLPRTLPAPALRPSYTVGRSYARAAQHPAAPSTAHLRTPSLAPMVAPYALQRLKNPAQAYMGASHRNFWQKFDQVFPQPIQQNSTPAVAADAENDRLINIMPDVITALEKIKKPEGISPELFVDTILEILLSKEKLLKQRHAEHLATLASEIPADMAPTLSEVVIERYIVPKRATYDKEDIGALYELTGSSIDEKIIKTERAYVIKGYTPFYHGSNSKIELIRQLWRDIEQILNLTALGSSFATMLRNPATHTNVPTMQQVLDVACSRNYPDSAPYLQNAILSVTSPLHSGYYGGRAYESAMLFFRNPPIHMGNNLEAYEAFFHHAPLKQIMPYINKLVELQSSLTKKGNAAGFKPGTMVETFAPNEGFDQGTMVQIFVPNELLHKIAYHAAPTGFPVGEKYEELRRQRSVLGCENTKVRIRPESDAMQWAYDTYFDLMNNASAATDLLAKLYVLRFLPDLVEPQSLNRTPQARLLLDPKYFLDPQTPLVIKTYQEDKYAEKFQRVVTEQRTIIRDMFIARLKDPWQVGWLSTNLMHAPLLHRFTQFLRSNPELIAIRDNPNLNILQKAAAIATYQEQHPENEFGGYELEEIDEGLLQMERIRQRRNEPFFKPKTPFDQLWARYGSPQYRSESLVATPMQLS